MTISTATLNLLSDAELLSLNNQVVTLIRSRRKKDAYAKLDEFVVGQVVEFTGKGGIVHTMKITRLNQKTASGVELSPKTGGKWRVPASFLRVVTDPDALAAPTLKSSPALVEAMLDSMEDSTLDEQHAKEAGETLFTPSKPAPKTSFTSEDAGSW